MEPEVMCEKCRVRAEMLSMYQQTLLIVYTENVQLLSLECVNNVNIYF